MCRVQGREYDKKVDENKNTVTFNERGKNTHRIYQEKGIPAGISLLKVNNRNTRTRCEICSKLTIETLEQGVKYVQS